MFWLFGGEASGVSAPRSGTKPMLPALEDEVLTTGLPGKSWPYWLLQTKGLLRILRMSHADPLNNKAFETLKNHCPIAISPGKIHLFTLGGTKSATRRPWTKGSKNEYRWGGKSFWAKWSGKALQEITSVSRLVELSGFVGVQWRIKAETNIRATRESLSNQVEFDGVTDDSSFWAGRAQLCLQGDECGGKMK